MTRALVTGGTGFAGRFLVQRLSGDGVEVHATSHASHTEAPGAASIHALDIRDADAVDELVAAVRPDELYHLAGITHPALDDVAGFYDVNVDGARRLLESTLRHVPTCRVLLVGSAYAYAPCGGPIDEAWTLEPRNHYGASKAAAEMVGRAYASEGLHVALARPFNHSGPGQSPEFVLPTIVGQVAAALDEGRSSMTLELGNVESVRDISDVRDVVEAYVRILRAGAVATAYNVGSGDGRSIKQLVQLVADLAGADVDIASSAERRRSSDVSRLVADISRVRELGWRPVRTLDTTITDMLAAARHVRASTR